MPEIIKEPTRFVTRKQIADMLGIHYLTVYEWEKAGRLTAHKLAPGIVRYPIEELEALLEKSKVKSTKPNGVVSLEASGRGCTDMNQ